MLISRRPDQDAAGLYDLTAGDLAAWSGLAPNPGTSWQRWSAARNPRNASCCPWYPAWARNGPPAGRAFRVWTDLHRLEEELMAVRSRRNDRRKYPAVWKKPRTRGVLEKLRRAGLKFRRRKEGDGKSLAEKPLSSRGRWPFHQEEAEEVLRGLGARVTSSVSRPICGGGKPGQQMPEGVDLGVTV